MPQFSLIFILDAIAIIHAVKTGRTWPWIYVIFLLPGIGVAAYLLMEVLPQYRYAPRMRRAQSSIGQTVLSGRRYKALRGELDIADTVANRLALAQECLATQKYDEALGLYQQIVASPQGDEPLYYIGKAQAELGLEQGPTALATIEELQRRWPREQVQEVQLLHARALEQAGRNDEALKEYDRLAPVFAGQEVQVRRLQLLDRMGRGAEAKAIASEVVQYRKRAPRHARFQQAEWFSAAQKYLKSAR